MELSNKGSFLEDKVVSYFSESWSIAVDWNYHIEGYYKLVLKSVKNLPAAQETTVLSLGQEDPLEREMAIHFSILVWKTLWTEEPSGLYSMGSQELDMT